MKCPLRGILMTLHRPETLMMRPRAIPTTPHRPEILMMRLLAIPTMPQHLLDYE